jgi:hypothetical protein
MNSRAFLTPAQAADPVQGSFDTELFYQFKIDNDNEYLEDRVIHATTLLFVPGDGLKRLP